MDRSATASTIAPSNAILLPTSFAVFVAMQATWLAIVQTGNVVETGATVLPRQNAHLQVASVVATPLTENTSNSCKSLAEHHQPLPPSVSKLALVGMGTGATTMAARGTSSPGNVDLLGPLPLGSVVVMKIVAVTITAVEEAEHLGPIVREGTTTAATVLEDTVVLLARLAELLHGNRMHLLRLRVALVDTVAMAAIQVAVTATADMDSLAWRLLLGLVLLLECMATMAVDLLEVFHLLRLVVLLLHLPLETSLHHLQAISHRHHLLVLEHSCCGDGASLRNGICW